MPVGVMMIKTNGGHVSLYKIISRWPTDIYEISFWSVLHVEFDYIAHLFKIALQLCAKWAYIMYVKIVDINPTIGKFGI